MTLLLLLGLARMVKVLVLEYGATYAYIITPALLTGNPTRAFPPIGGRFLHTFETVPRNTFIEMAF